MEGLALDSELFEFKANVCRGKFKNERLSFSSYHLLIQDSG